MTDFGFGMIFGAAFGGIIGMITMILLTVSSVHEDREVGGNSPPTGEWKISSDGYYPYCSQCGNEPPGMKITRFCPCCGARMED